MERQITSILLGLSFFAGLVMLSTMLWSHANTFAMVAPVIRLFDPTASPASISRIHRLSRKAGHFFIPAVGFWLLAAGPMRKRPVAALLVCAAFACADETLQMFSPGRTGSIYDVLLDTAGAVFGFCIYSALAQYRRKPAISYD